MAFTSKKRRLKVLDTYMAYIDTRVGECTVVFLHGNPASSYVWRNILPQVQGVARCVAPDLLGMGHSGRQPQASYRFKDHYHYLAAWFEAVRLPAKLILVMHEWGSALGFHWAFNNQHRIQALVHMESFVAPFSCYEDIGTKIAQDFFRRMRHDQNAEELVLQNNYLLEMSLAGMTLNRQLKEQDFAAYRAPFETPGESRRPTLVWTREIPIEEEGPEDVVQIVREYSSWLASSVDVPKLYIHADPGLYSQWVQKMTSHWPNQLTTTVKGRHFLQEESPEDIAHSLIAFVRTLINY